MDDPRTPTEPAPDDGRAVLELAFLAVLVLIPIMYIALSVIRFQATTFAVAQAARDAARLIDNAPSLAIGHQQALAAARIALDDQNVPSGQITLHYIAAGADCTTAPPLTPRLTPGALFDICVTTPLDLPLLPADLTAANTITASYTLHVGEFREGR